MSRLQTSHRDQELRRRFGKKTRSKFELAPRLELLEDRLPPGDTVLGALLGQTVIASTMPRNQFSLSSNAAQRFSHSIGNALSISVTRASDGQLSEKSSNDKSQWPDPLPARVASENHQLQTAALPAKNGLFSLQLDVASAQTELYDPLNQSDPFGELTPPIGPGIVPSDSTLPKQPAADTGATGSSEIGLAELSDEASPRQSVLHPTAPVNQVLGDLLALTKFSDKGGEGHITDLEPACAEATIDGLPWSPVYKFGLPVGHDGVSHSLTANAVYTFIAWGTYTSQPPNVGGDALYANFANPALTTNGLTFDNFSPDYT
jgi:hypothetical protein